MSVDRRKRGWVKKKKSEQLGQRVAVIFYLYPDLLRYMVVVLVVVVV